MIQFSSQYNKDDKLDERDFFHAIDDEGNVYDVHETYVTDNRTKSGFRLTRIDLTTEECILHKPLFVLPEEYSETEKWLMLKVVALLDTVDGLKDEIGYLNDSIERTDQNLENLEREHRND